MLRTAKKKKKKKEKEGRATDFRFLGQVFPIKHVTICGPSKMTWCSDMVLEWRNVSREN